LSRPYLPEFAEAFFGARKLKNPLVHEYLTGPRYFLRHYRQQTKPRKCFLQLSPALPGTPEQSGYRDMYLIPPADRTITVRLIVSRYYIIFRPAPMATPKLTDATNIH
jgi:hypothetical protein